MRVGWDPDRNGRESQESERENRRFADSHRLQNIMRGLRSRREQVGVEGELKKGME